MKKLLPFLFFALLFSNKQVSAQIPNGDFETLNWDGTLSNWGNVYLMAVSIDSLGNTFMDSIVWDGPYYSKTVDANTGNFAMEMRNAYNYTTNHGIAGSVSADTDSVYTAWGALEFVSIQIQPTDFSFYYKYNSVGDDSGIARLTVYDYMMNPIGNAEVVFSGISSVYTYTSVPITFTSLDPVAYYSLNFSTKFSLADIPTEPHLGTSLIIDDVHLSSTTGIGSNNLMENSYSLFPNPSKENLNISSKNSEEINYCIYNMLGKKILEGKILPGTQSISTQQFSNGVYAIEFVSSNHSSRMNFVVAH